MSHLCLCAKGLVSSASQLMPSYHRLQYSCGQRIQHICPPLLIPALLTPCQPWKSHGIPAPGTISVFWFCFSNHSRLLTQPHQTSFQRLRALLLRPYIHFHFPPFSQLPWGLLLPSSVYLAMSTQHFNPAFSWYSKPIVHGCFIMHTPQGSKGITEIISPSLYSFLDITDRTAFSSLQILYQNGNV